MELRQLMQLQAQLQEAHKREKQAARQSREVTARLSAAEATITAQKGELDVLRSRESGWEEQVRELTACLDAAEEAVSPQEGGVDGSRLEKERGCKAGKEEFSREFGDTQRVLIEAHNERDRWDGECKKLDEVVAELQERLTCREMRVRELREMYKRAGGVVKELDRRNRELETQVGEKDGKIREFEVRVRDMDNTIRKLDCKVGDEKEAAEERVWKVGRGRTSVCKAAQGTLKREQELQRMIEQMKFEMGAKPEEGTKVPISSEGKV